MSRLKQLIREIHRRSLWQVLGIYVASSWVVFEVAQTLTEGLGLPHWVPALAFVLLLVGLPIVLATAFVQEGLPIVSPAQEASPEEGGAAAEEVGRAPPHSEAAGRLFTWRNAGVGGLLAFTLLGVVTAGYMGIRFLGRDEVDGIDSIAVLPLKNLMGDPEQEYFVEGMHEALITELSRVSALKVISRTSTIRFRQTEKPLTQVARELNVDAVIEGSVLRDSSHIRITVQLIDGQSDRHLWAHAFDRELHSILALQSEVARAIVNEIRVSLTAHERAELTRTRSVNLDAYEAYLRGRYHWNRRTEIDLERALAYFEQAIDADSTYALAHAAIAETYNLLPGYGDVSVREAFPKARAAALKALDLDVSLGEAYIPLANAKWRLGWDWSAEIEFRRGLGFSPNYATGHQWYGAYLTAMGRYQEGIEELKRAVTLDPLSLIINADLGAEGYYFARQYAQAVIELQKVIELDPHFYYAHLHLCESYVQLARYDLAIAECEEAAALSGRTTQALSSLGYSYAVAGRNEAAWAILRELKERANHTYVDPFSLALIYTGLGMNDEALAFLHQAFAERSVRMVWIKRDPKFDRLRSTARFQELVRRMNFPG